MLSKEQIDKIIESHGKWLRNEDGGEMANLSRADLSWANLSRANLSRADLSRANLRWANLSRANLSRADLSWADLRGADLRWADLRGADLRGADLRWADLRGANLIILQTDIWTAYIQPDDIHIGCQYHPAKKWFSYHDETISKMDSEALEWWKRWKPVIQAIHSKLAALEADKQEAEHV